MVSLHNSLGCPFLPSGSIVAISWVPINHWLRNWGKEMCGVAAWVISFLRIVVEFAEYVFCDVLVPLTVTRSRT